MWIGIGIGIGAVVLLGIVMIAAYNGAAKKKLRVDNAFSQIKIQYKRRADLIPYLADVVKSYAANENITLTPAVEVSSPEQLSDAEYRTGRALHQLNALAAKNPGLNTNAHFMQLQNELANLERAISVSRGFYNDAVMLYNRTVQTFPTLLFAKLFRFKPAEFIHTETAADSLIKGVPCPSCGAIANSETCPHCGTRIPLL